MINLGMAAVVLIVGPAVGIAFLLVVVIEARRADAAEKARARAATDSWPRIPRNYRR